MNELLGGCGWSLSKLIEIDCSVDKPIWIFASFSEQFSTPNFDKTKVAPKISVMPQSFTLIPVARNPWIQVIICRFFPDTKALRELEGARANYADRQSPCKMQAIPSSTLIVYYTVLNRPPSSVLLLTTVNRKEDVMGYTYNQKIA